jgi:hypothetical protein
MKLSGENLNRPFNLFTKTDIRSIRLLVMVAFSFQKMSTGNYHCKEWMSSTPRAVPSQRYSDFFFSAREKRFEKVDGDRKHSC